MQFNSNVAKSIDESTGMCYDGYIPGRETCHCMFNWNYRNGIGSSHAPSITYTDTLAGGKVYARSWARLF
jgi:hypothetical protein